MGNFCIIFGSLKLLKTTGCDDQILQDFNGFEDFWDPFLLSPVTKNLKQKFNFKLHFLNLMQN